MRIDDFYLNKNEKSTVLSYCERNAFPQTILIEGGSMQMRLDFAGMLANMIVCTGDGEKPCGVCNACIKCAAHSHPDVKEYGEEKEKYTFKVELSREIRSDAFVIPNDSDRKVYIIKEAQNMNDSSENALLKIFEEPPYFDYFIMTCPSKSAMLDTVLSRAQVISLGYTEESFDDALLAQCTAIVKALVGSDELALTESLAQLSSDKDSFLPTVGCLKRTFLEALKKLNGADVNPIFGDSINTLINKYSQLRLYSLVSVCSELEADFRQNANYNLLLTYMAVRLSGA